MKISINGIEIAINKDYESASIRSGQDFANGPIYVSLYISGLVIDHKVFQILDAAFKNSEPIAVKFLDNGFDRDLNMMVRSQDVTLDVWKDIPTSYIVMESVI